MMLKNRMTRWVVGLALVAMTAGLSACSDNAGPSGGTGTLQMRLVDAPTFLDGVTSISVTFQSVMVHRSSDATESDGGWVTVLADTASVDARTFDLLDLVNGAYDVLGETELQAGHYTQVRLIVDSATVTVGGTTYGVTIPSGSQTGIKLVGGFDVDPNVITTLTLDFDAGSSVHAVPVGSTNFVMKPTIRMIQTIESGTISGTVMPTGISALVVAYEAGTQDTVTTTMVDPTTGGFVLQALLAGDYDVEVSASGYSTVLQEGVSVTAGEDAPDIDFTLVASGG